MATSIIRPGTIEYEHALDYFGLTPIIFQEIGGKILGAYRQTTPNDAKSAAGTYAYFAAIRALRDFLCPSGWQPHSEGNIEMVLAESGRFAITASSGDKNAGRYAGNDPKTKNHKGRQTGTIVNKNQGWLPGFEPAEPAYDPEKTPTWFLLYHIDSLKNKIQMELSLPINIDVYTLKVDRWRQRIILSDVTLDATPINRSNQQVMYSDFDIEIKRKTNE